MVAHGMKLDSMCSSCSQKDETVMHALWRCYALKCVRFASCITRNGKCLDSIPFLDFVMSSLILETRVFEWAINYLGDFRNVNLTGGHGSSKQQMTTFWKAPPAGVYKINTDAALSISNKTSGFGVVIRDCNGNVIASFYQNDRVCYQPQVAEALAIL
ncbi:hypothetical protein Dsin_002262 [Dipteronia sinensis]|uniref:RNase H type-1 domain-containing protein n=1 Tax=Dipteronia sinensis TaxID=43782 RepID=A0AAE0B5F8_9ROSI|nr:hypothetical protein Dsin_002262 [Dipteronia sinensis]